MEVSEVFKKWAIVCDVATLIIFGHPKYQFMFFGSFLFYKSEHEEYQNTPFMLFKFKCCTALCLFNTFFHIFHFICSLINIFFFCLSFLCYCFSTINPSNSMSRFKPTTFKPVSNLSAGLTVNGAQRASLSPRCLRWSWLTTARSCIVR